MGAEFAAAAEVERVAVAVAAVDAAAVEVVAAVVEVAADGSIPELTLSLSPVL